MQLAVMIVHCSLAYERRNSVASTETALEPTSLTMVIVDDDTNYHPDTK